MVRGFYIAVLLLATVSFASANGVTAFTALKTAQRNSGSAQLVEVTGERGEPQPQQWTFLFKAPTARGGVLEIVVAGNEIVALRTPLRGYTGTTTQPELAPASLVFDSDSVFRLVNKEADLRKVGFHWLDYSLRSDSVTGAPVWTVNIYDAMGPRVGMMRISGRDGSIVTPLQIEDQYRVETKRRASTSPPVEAAERVVDTVGTVTKDTANRVKNSTLRAVGTVQEIITGDRTIGPTDEE